MARSAEFWIQFHNTFNPDEKLAGKRSEDLFCDREYSPFEIIQSDFRPEIQRKVAFFTGHRGSGKSSMLLRVIERLKENFFPVYFDIEHNLDSSKTNQLDLLLLLGAAIHKTAKQEGMEPGTEHLDNLVSSIYTVTREVKGTDKDDLNLAEMVKGVICFGASVLGNSIVEKLAEAALKPFTLSSGVSEEIARKREIEPQVQKIIGHLKQIADEVKRLSGKEVLAVVDGLDKLQQFKQAEAIFLESRALREPVCRLIYTVPMLINRDPRFALVEQDCHSYFYPNIKLYDRNDDRKRHDDGYKALREVVRKRLSMLDARGSGLTEEEIFDSGALDQLILMSGGVIRLFINLVQSAGKQAEILGLDRINPSVVQRVVDDEVVRITGRLTLKILEELRTVRDNKCPSDNTEEINNLLHGLFIVAYRDRSTWYDAHPLLWEELSKPKGK